MLTNLRRYRLSFTHAHEERGTTLLSLARIYGGPPRKYYTLTEEGQQLLAQLNEEWQSICQAINLITKQ